jgi:lysophospholipase L1-like esterase
MLIITYSGTTYEPVATIDEAETTAPRIVLPDTLYSVVGDTLQLFVRGMVEAQDPYALPVFMSSTITGISTTASSIPRAYPRYLEVTPIAADVGDENFTITILDNDYGELATKTVGLVVSNTTGSITPATNKNFLCLGDSLTASGQWPTELYRRLTQAGSTPAGLSKANITFVGDKDMSAYTGTAAYTGNSGWIWNNFIGGDSRDAYIVTDAVNTFDKTIVGTTGTDGVGGTWYIEYVDTPNDQVKIYRTAGATTLPATGTITMSGQNIVYTASTASTASPFISSSGFDFAAWQTRNVSVGTLDAIYVLLGWNGITDPNMTPDMTDVRTFLDTLHGDIDTTIVRIIGIQVPSPFGGIGTRYDSESAYGQYYALLRTANNLNIAYQDLANEAAYSSWVEFVGMMPQLDSEYMYTFTDTAVNTRLPGTTEVIQTNGIHPTTAGYLQVADAVYREFIATFLE